MTDNREEHVDLPGYLRCVHAGAFVGLVLGTVLAITDPLILTVGGKAARTQLWNNVAFSIVVLVPPMLVGGMIVAFVLRLLRGISAALYRLASWLLPLGWAAVVFAYAMWSGIGVPGTPPGDSSSEAPGGRSGFYHPGRAVGNFGRLDGARRIDARLADGNPTVKARASERPPDRPGHGSRGPHVVLRLPSQDDAPRGRLRGKGTCLQGRPVAELLDTSQSRVLLHGTSRFGSRCHLDSPGPGQAIRYARRAIAGRRIPDRRTVVKPDPHGQSLFRPGLRAL